MQNSVEGNQFPLSGVTEQDFEYLKGIVAETTSPTHALVGASDQQKKTEVSYDAALLVAAFLGGFDPLKLILHEDQDILRRLLNDCTTSTDGDTSRWQLKASVRKRVLANLTHTKNGLSKGAEQAKLYLKRSRESPDDIASALIELAGGVRIERDQIVRMSKALSTAYQTVLEWFEWPTTTDGRNTQSLLVDLKVEDLLEPFRFLTGYNPESGKDLFVGREDALTQLRSFVDILRSKSVFESTSRSIRNVFREKSRALFVSGIGGIGKSTLIAKFILQHLDSRAKNQIRFAYLDFDRSTISAAQPATLLLELIRQLGWQAREVRTTLELISDRVRAEMKRTKREADGGIRGLKMEAGTRHGSNLQNMIELPPELIGESLLFTYLIELNGCLIQPRIAKQPFLLVLDTFEEAQALGDEAVRRVENFINLAMQNVKDLRVVIVGRDEALNFFPNAERLSLKEFKDITSRRAILEVRGVPHSISARVAKEVGGRPLALLLAARLVKDHGEDSVTLSFGEKFNNIFLGHLIEGILYDRILSHIPDADVRKLAHPGLVLRRVNSDVISRVIAPVLNLGEFPSDKCERVMEMLRRQKDLVYVDTDGSVRHRSDVREQMLVLMTAEKPEMVRRLHHAAIAYYESRQECVVDELALERDRIEEIYHRLAVGAELEKIPDLWSTKARLDLARTVDEIPNPAGRGTLKIMLGRVPNSEEAKGLPSRLLTEFSVRSLRVSITSDAPEKALTILEEYSESLPEEVRLTLEPLALDRAGAWDEACEKYLRIINDKRLQSLPDTLLAVADFFERWQYSREVPERLVGVLSKLLSENGNLKIALPLSLTILRLRIRLGYFNEKRVSGKEIVGLFDEHSWPITDVPTNNAQWLVTLTDEVDKNGLLLFEGMPVSDAVRSQVKFLSVILKTTRQDDKHKKNVQEVCDVLIRSKKIGTQLGKQLEDQGRGRSVVLVMRHIMRPSTPQWYVPLACTLRGEWGPEIKLDNLYGGDLPRLPFEVPATLRTTKALADLLGQFDQIGILPFTLDQVLERQPSLNESKFSQIVDAFRSWRVDMFPELDPWIEAFLGNESEGT